MKTIVLIVVCVLLAIALGVVKHSDSADLDTANGTITDFSNRLDTAQTLLTARENDLVTLSNSLTTITAAYTTSSNQLTDAQSTLVQQSDQITNLTRQVTETTAANQALSANLLDATNQMAALTAQNARTAASLDQTNTDYVQLGKDYGLLQNRFQRDVAERLLVARRFYNLSEVEAQVQRLKQDPTENLVTPETLYRDLDVEIKSNGVAHVIAPD